MSFPILDRLLDSLQRAHTPGDSRAFAEALVCSPRDGEIWTALKTELISNPTAAPTHLQTTLRQSPLLPFLNTLIAYLLATSWNPQEPSPAVAEREWKLFDAVYAEANRLFTAGGAEGAGFLGRGMRKMAENLMHLGFQTAYAECRMDEGDTVAKRGDEAFALGNICWKVYDQLHAYRLLDTIIQTYNSIRPSPLARLAAPCTTMAERVGYWYWVGKLALAKGDVRRAREFLKNAFDMCPVHAERNLRAIFIRLLACQILLGSFPAPHLLSHFNLHAQFGPVIQAIRTGDRAMYYRCFEEWGGWYRKRGLWLVLREKGEVLVWRSLFRNTYRIWTETNPPVNPAAKSARCSTTIFLTAMRLSFAQCGEEDVDATDVVSILASLIDQLSYSQQYLVMRKVPGDPFAGFPAVSSVRPRSYTSIG
ncbi:hypothetical protein QFC20_007337 [Naganishia adeliensis]|uniref:Uncharacterized protein n=1 Tax=Naganishia adeliensis TaxID=92952 RepID=A0ACC2V007_9TREE|nr:hypothetical protein QFC20_007337 [Naganishia adeliensis]